MGRNASSQEPNLLLEPFRQGREARRERNCRHAQFSRQDQILLVQNLRQLPADGAEWSEPAVVHVGDVGDALGSASPEAPPAVSPRQLDRAPGV